jgi:microcystin-dependent protein
MSTELVNQGIKFPNETVQESALPAGSIIIWGGFIENIPSGWYLCDGQNGTIDLRNYFIVGAGDKYSLNETGGEKTTVLSQPKLPQHSHPVENVAVDPGGSHSHSNKTTSTRPSHSHSSNLNVDATGALNYESNGFEKFAFKFNSGGGGSHSHPSSVSEAPDHKHPVTVNVGDTPSLNNADPHENRPPYYALAFIMEVST